ncbi:MAG: ATP-binding cassette domain-containing protein [Tenericutes bacterium]|jgi:ABC-2 type transport system ATP-binding protein|nr:ATP-binding cassette domain-containing protein [Mycoplasmatota bacterium]
MLEVNNVVLKYDDFVAVKDLSFTIKPGEIFGLLGTNGAGKTTTFRVIMGLLDPSEGEVLYNGERVGYHNVDEIGYMIEERSLLTKITVKELLLYFGQLKSMEKDLIIKRLDFWLDYFNITEYKNKKIKELSKGNQQKIQFISAIINDPKLLVLDEPFSGLDPINTELFVKTIRKFQEEGKMIVFSSHQLDHVESFCEQIVVLEKGEAIIQGDIKQVKQDFKKMTININAEVDIKTLETLPGVYNVIQNTNKISVKINSDDYIKGIFDYVKTCDNVTLFDVEQASLSEIFIEKVGGSREKI